MKKIPIIIVLIGGLNLGGIGVFGVDLLGNIFGGTYEFISRMIYFIVGIASVYLCLNLDKILK